MPWFAPVTGADLRFSSRSIGTLALHPRLPCYPQLAQRRERRALRQHLGAVGANFAEQRLIDGRHHQAGPLLLTVCLRQQREGGPIVAERALDLEFHELPEAVAFARMHDVRHRYLIARELVERQIDSVAPRVFAHVADYVGEL